MDRLPSSSMFASLVTRFFANGAKITATDTNYTDYTYTNYTYTN